MSGTESSPEASDAMPPTSGIEPPTSGDGPPPPPELDVVATPRIESVDSAAVPTWGQPDTAPQSSARPVAIAAVVLAIVAVLALVLGLVVIGIGNIVSLAGYREEAGPTSEIEDPGQSDPFPDPFAPAADSGAVEASLQATIDEYKSARDSGSLWNTIPDSSYNRTALSAFLYLLVDMKLAASFGGDTTGYLERADELEQKLLNQEPLGSDISIKLSDRTFTYDGETGEGGYTAN